jgi:glycosyltransferase involved in cell wall biosynthesis
VRLVVLKNIAAPYTTALFELLSRRCELLVLYEAKTEPNRAWPQPAALPFRATVLRSRTVDLRRFKSDTFLHLPWRPLVTLRKFSPDVVIASGGVWTSPTNVAALLARHRERWAFVPWWGRSEPPDPPLHTRVAKPIMRAFVRPADAWLAYGSRAAADLVRLGADPDRIFVSHNVPPLARPDSARQPNSTRRLLYAGQLIERKGIDLLLDAFAATRGALLDVVGDGPMMERVRAVAAVDPRITVHGHLQPSELEALYRQVDAVVVPSRYDAWSQVINEALSHALPVVATEGAAATYDVIDHGVNGLVTPLGPSAVERLADAMNSVASWNEEHYRAVFERHRRKLIEFSPDRAVDGILDAARAAEEHRRRRSMK